MSIPNFVGMILTAKRGFVVFGAEKTDKNLSRQRKQAFSGSQQAQWFLIMDSNCKALC